MYSFPGSAVISAMRKPAEFKGADGVEAEDEVVGVAVGGGVAQGAEGVEGADGLLRFVGVVYALGFVNDDDGAGGLDEFDGLAA
jgi:hypothetical protein